mgnify:CR=1 FL=1
MANIKPLGQRVLVKRIEAETKTAGGLFLPDTAKEKPQEAERKSNWTEKTTLSCLKMIFWPSSAKRHRTHTQHHFKY